MKEPRRKVLHNVSVYFTDHFYIIGLVQESNLSWVEALPVHQVPAGQVVALAHALETAREASHRFSRQAPPLVPSTMWDGENKTVWKNATKTWSVRWHDDGSVLVAPQERFTPVDEPDLVEGVGRRRTRGSEQLLSPPVLPERIAQLLIV